MHSGHQKLYFSLMLGGGGGGSFTPAHPVDRTLISELTVKSLGNSMNLRPGT